MTEDPQKTEWEITFDAIDRMTALRDKSFRAQLELLVFAVESNDINALNRAMKDASEALYPESGGVPPWRKR